MSQKNYLQLIDSPWRVAAFTALVYFIYILIFLSFCNFNLSGFIWFGENFIHAEEMPIEISGKISPDGYDGQFYYRLALDPFTTKVEDYGIKLDMPVYRQQRILYPLFVHILSFGSPQLAVFFMTFVNYVAICGIAFLSAMLLMEFDKKPIWALAFAFYPGMVICLTRGLTEPLAVLFSVASLFLLYKDKQAVASLFLAMAILTRETTIIIALSGGILWLFQKLSNSTNFKKNKITWFYFGIPLIVFLMWQFALFYMWGVFPVSSVEPKVSIPFIGIYKSVLDFLSFKHPAHPIYLVEVIWIFIFAAYVVCSLRKSDWFIKINWLLYSVIALSLTRLIWDNHQSFFRVLSEFYVFGIIIILAGSSRVKYFIVSIGWCFWITAAAIEIYIYYRFPIFSG